MNLVKDKNPYACGSDEEWTNLVDRGGFMAHKEHNLPIVLCH